MCWARRWGELMHRWERQGRWWQVVLDGGRELLTNVCRKGWRRGELGNRSHDAGHFQESDRPVLALKFQNVLVPEREEKRKCLPVSGATLRRGVTGGLCDTGDGGCDGGWVGLELLHLSEAAGMHLRTLPARSVAGSFADHPGHALPEVPHLGKADLVVRAPCGSHLVPASAVALQGWRALCLVVDLVIRVGRALQSGVDVAAGQGQGQGSEDRVPCSSARVLQ